MGRRVFIPDVWPEALMSWFILEACTAVQLAGLGVAVANAGGPAKAAADVVMQETNDQDAVARAIEQFVLSQS